MEDKETEILMRERAIELTIEFFEGKTCSPETFMKHLETIYTFLKTGNINK